METTTYEYLKSIGKMNCILSGIDNDELIKNPKINFDLRVVKDEVYSLPKITDRLIKFEVLELVHSVNIQDILEDACRGSIEKIAFDTLSTTVEVASLNISLLSEEGKTNLFVFGSNNNFFISRVYKTDKGVSHYVGLKNFDLPLRGGGIHRFFIKRL